MLVVGKERFMEQLGEFIALNCMALCICPRTGRYRICLMVDMLPSYDRSGFIIEFLPCSGNLLHIYLDIIGE